MIAFFVGLAVIVLLGVISVIGVLLLVQVSVADILGLVAGHTPGTSVEESHANPLFRAARAHANTNETLGSFVVLVIFSISISANPHWVKPKLHPTGGPVPHYLTLTGGPRVVELGAFLTEDERKILHGELRARLADLR